MAARNKKIMEITIGQLLREYRKTNKIKGVELAKEIGVTYQHIWNIEKNNTNISIELFLKILDVLNVKPSDFFRKYELLKYLNERLELSIYIEKGKPLHYCFQRREGRELKNILSIQGDRLAYTDFTGEVIEGENIDKTNSVLLRCSIYNEEGIRNLKEYLR